MRRGQWRMHPPPRELHRWVHLSRRGRRWWLKQARLRLDHESVQPASPGRTVILPGRFITDFSSFLCAMGEAVNGPGGYFGAGEDAFSDCLCGGFGLEWPWTIIWEDSDFSRQAMDRAVADRSPLWSAAYEPPGFDWVAGKLGLATTWPQADQRAVHRPELHRPPGHSESE